MPQLVAFPGLRFQLNPQAILCLSRLEHAFAHVANLCEYVRHCSTRSIISSTHIFAEASIKGKAPHTFTLLRKQAMQRRHFPAVLFSKLAYSIQLCLPSSSSSSSARLSCWIK